MSTRSQYYYQRVLVSTETADGHGRPHDPVPRDELPVSTGGPFATPPQNFYPTPLVTTTINTANCRIQFPETLDGQYLVRYITIPNTLYAVNATNQNIDWANGAAHTATIPVGNYTGTTLAAAVQLAMDTADAVRVYTVVYSDTTHKLTITTDDTSAVVFAGGNLNTCWRVVGVAETGGVSLASAAAFPFPIFLSCPLSLGIRIKQAPDAGYVVGQQQGTLIVPLLSEANAFNYYSNDDFQQYLKFEKGTKTMDIRVVNPVTGAVVELNRGPWEMLLERIEPNLSIPKLKRQRIFMEPPLASNYR
jgi:hypothetical protein